MSCVCFVLVCAPRCQRRQDRHERQFGSHCVSISAHPAEPTTPSIENIDRVCAPRCQRRRDRHERQARGASTRRAPNSKVKLASAHGAFLPQGSGGRGSPYTLGTAWGPAMMGTLTLGTGWGPVMGCPASPMLGIFIKYKELPPEPGRNLLIRKESICHTVEVSSR